MSLKIFLFYVQIKRENVSQLKKVFSEILRLYLEKVILLKRF